MMLVLVPSDMISILPKKMTSVLLLDRVSCCSLQLCKAQIKVIFFVVLSSAQMSSFHHIPSRRLGSNSASHFTLPRTQACFPRPIVLFCLGDGISLTASAYRGIQSNANSADRNVTHNLVVVFSSVKLKS